ncbi:aminotransferase class IV [Saprospiraceae bacterium]|nr:aminotransferase class IV [Saprospiraceae bacterium]MDC1508102.1 aminotransferase class IV [Saprospiraceae bacterium]|tara:strand:- start:1012 stop:1911 length:900 start_codon:yes stop_codon:yes gene_type:complete
MLQKSDSRNVNIKIYVDGQILNRDEAQVSVFDSVVQGGDAVWEGLRVYRGGIFCLDRHLNRLMDSAKAMAFVDVPNKSDIKKALTETLQANGMTDDVHIRLTLTRGRKTTSGMDPRLNIFGPTLIILPEYKPPVYDNENGITVITSTIRRNSPNNLDSKIHHNNLINNILAKIQSNVAGADAALMLDNYGFASELNGTNIFMVKDGIIYTPHADACLHGITRGLIIQLARENNFTCIEKNISLTEMYSADEVFCTGTMGELTPIVSIDGRKIENKSISEILPKLIYAFEESIHKYTEKI